MSDLTPFLIIIAALLIGFGIGAEVGRRIEKYDCNLKLIERGLKHYDSKTGELIWKEDE